MTGPQGTAAQDTVLNSEEINAALAGTPFAGGLHRLATVNSTNTLALEQARAGAPNGSYYVADEQTAGRGRSDHRWHSAAGEGLYLSALLRPALSPSDRVWVPLMAGLAAHAAIAEVTGLAADLRWPNDLLIGPRKVGGILVETASDGQSGHPAVVVGIGINLHQREFPADLATPATSLDLETGACISRQELLIALLRRLHAEMLAFDSVLSAKTIPVRIEAASTWVRGRRVEVHGPQACSGETAGLDARGFLRVETGAGVVTVTTGGLRALPETP